MNQESFEAKILQLWITTLVPFTRANLQFATGAPRKKMERWLEELVLDGVLDSDVDDLGEMVYQVRGADRPRSGPGSLAELDKLAQLSREARAAVGSAASALVLSREARGGGSLTVAPGASEKSMVLSGILSFIFGPLGWLYAGHWKEALPVVGVLFLLKWILPAILFMPFWGIVAPVSAGVGVLYAWKYNRTGERQKMLPAPTSDE